MIIKKIKLIGRRLLAAFVLCTMIAASFPSTASAISFDSWQYKNALEVYNVLHARGYTNAGISGILGNMMIESRMNPTSGNSTFYGLCAWGYSRASALRSTADCASCTTQANFLADEVDNMSTLKEILTTTDDPHYAAERFCRIFEKPSNPNMTPRYNYADEFMRFLSAIPSVSNFRIFNGSASMHFFGVKWNVAGSVSGYEIQYSTKEDFSEDCQSLTLDDPNRRYTFIENLKGDTKYYVRMRALYTLNDMQLASDFSETISCTTEIDPFVYFYKAHVYYADRIIERAAARQEALLKAEQEALLKAEQEAATEADQDAAN